MIVAVSSLEETTTSRIQVKFSSLSEFRGLAEKRCEKADHLLCWALLVLLHECGKGLE